MQVARIFMLERFTREAMFTLRHWRGAFWCWQVSHWIELEDRAVRSQLYGFTENAYFAVGDRVTSWAPNRRKIGDLAEALAAICILSSDIDQPSWLDGTATGVIVAVENGLLDVEQLRLLPHTPNFFNQIAVPFAYNPRAEPPANWRAFLAEVWPDEPDAINVLGEWFGYVIAGLLYLHKILLMVGPTRGGKGVIARILSALIGVKNVAGPTLNSLGGEFGLAPLIGKSLAIISDARLGKNSNIVVERLLSISGEDTITVNRKYREQWNGKLPCRLHVISNELPRLGDASTAIVGRFVLLLTTRSWLGKEDHELEQRLRGELPGILNWSLDGLKRLTADNHNAYTRVASADEAIIAMRDLASPVAAFVRERCEIGTDKEVEVDRLYDNYKDWCQESEHPKHSKSVFGRDLRAAAPTLRKIRPRDRTDRRQTYIGICLRS
jgi:putative DNA primase/helicase